MNYAELEAENEGECVKRKTLSWRDEYVRAAAGWLPRYSWQAADGAVLEHATLDATGRALAIAADNASVAVSLSYAKFLEKILLRLNNI